MKSIFRSSAVFAGILALSACAGEPPKIIVRPEEPQREFQRRQETERYEVIDYQNAGLGGAIPEWVSRFLDQGISAVELMEVFNNRYVFIGTNRGNNFNALSHWMEGFTVDQDFPRMAAVRIEQRLTSAAALYPDDEYGEFFETAVKKASDAVYTGAVKEAVFWIRRRLYGEAVPDREQYDFFALVTIEKYLFQIQLNELLNNITTAVPPAREQAAAINRIRETFFENF
jgi:hypothetical protein